jgi:hypothetical protein
MWKQAAVQSIIYVSRGAMSFSPHSRGMPLSSNQEWGKIHPIRVRIRIREYSANLNFEKEYTIRRIRIRILKLKFEFA